MSDITKITFEQSRKMGMFSGEYRCMVFEENNGRKTEVNIFAPKGQRITFIDRAEFTAIGDADESKVDIDAEADESKPDDPEDNY